MYRSARSSSRASDDDEEKQHAAALRLGLLGAEEEEEEEGGDSMANPSGVPFDRSGRASPLIMHHGLRATPVAGGEALEAGWGRYAGSRAAAYTPLGGLPAVGCCTAALRFTVYSPASGVVRGASLAAVRLGGALPSWLDICRPTVGDLEDVARAFPGIHPLSIEDVQMRDAREKCEVFDDAYMFLCIATLGDAQPLHVAKADGAAGRDGTAPSAIYMLLFATHIITIHHEPIAHISRVLGRLMDTFTLQAAVPSDWIMYALLDDCVDEFVPALASLCGQVDAIDDLILTLSYGELSDMLRRIGLARRRVTALLRLLKPKSDIIRTLTRRSAVRGAIGESTAIYLRDVQDHVVSSIQDLEQYGETLNRSHGNYLAHISIELNDASNRMNVVMKKLTAAAAIVLPISLISGLWGMNVPVPGQDGVTTLYQLMPFFTILSAMTAILLSMYYVGHRIDWW